MASEVDAQDACNRIDDNAVLEVQLTALAALLGEAGSYDILITRGNETFNLSSLRGDLVAGSTDEDTMFTNIDTIVDDLIGADEVTQGTLRKELRDLVDANDADVAAT